MCKYLGITDSTLDFLKQIPMSRRTKLTALKANQNPTKPSSSNLDILWANLTEIEETEKEKGVGPSFQSSNKEKQIEEWVKSLTKSPELALVALKV